MTDFDKTLHAQLRHLIDDLTVAVDDDGHTLYAPKNTLMFSNFIGALIELMPTLAARAQPAQAVPDKEDFCYCNDEISLQIVSGGGADEGLYGRVTLKINGEYVNYVKAQQAEVVPPDVVRDAERYRWLRNESWAGYNTGKGTPSVYTVDGAGNRRMMLAEEAMDAAIDAAIAAQGEKS